MPGPKPACSALKPGGDLSCSKADPELELFCDPFTGEGCIEGEVCDISAGSGTACQTRKFYSSNCGLCGATGWCGPGTTCVSGVCAPFCCEDSQCSEGYCDKVILTGEPWPFGVCMAGEGGGGGAGAGGQGGAGAGGQGGAGAGGQGGAGAGGQGGAGAGGQGGAGGK
jgi:hypothetical protein